MTQRALTRGAGRQAIRAAATLALVAWAMPIAAAELLSRHADWSSYAHEDEGLKLCFVVSMPKDTQPSAVKRDAPHFYVSAWPKAGVRGEISIKMGYALRRGSEATVVVDDQTFRLFPASDRVFVADPTQELKLIEAMRRGNRMAVTATPERGAAITDTYSLAGIGQALQALSGCQ